MRWESGRRSSNVEDRRGQPVRRRRTGVKLGGSLAIAVLLIGLVTGTDVSGILSLLAEGSGGTQVVEPRGPVKPRSAEENKLADFVSVVLADTEDTWSVLFRKMGKNYPPPRLVLFSGSVRSACGLNTAAVGPFYCPSDRKVYIDLSFYNDLRKRFGAPGDFAQAYVIAHEVGHHLQTVLGTTQRIHSEKQRVSQVQANQLSVRQELQADCYAGVWAHHAHSQRQILEQGDVEEGLNAAAAIGDDRLQKKAHGTTNPESWTHGSSAQRVRWFKKGMKTGDMEACDTFKARKL